MRRLGDSQMMGFSRKELGQKDVLRPMCPNYDYGIHGQSLCPCEGWRPKGDDKTELFLVYCFDCAVFPSRARMRT